MRVHTFKGGQIRHYIRTWEALTSDQEILNIVKGDSIDFDSPPPDRHFVYNTKILDLHRDLLRTEITELLSKDIIVSSKIEEKEFLSPIFTVSKPEGDIRLILNLI